MGFQWRLKDQIAAVALNLLKCDRLKSSTRMATEGEKQPETLPIITALFILISSSLNETAPSKGFFVAQMKKPKSHKKAAAENFKLGIINTSQHSFKNGVFGLVCFKVHTCISSYCKVVFSPGVLLRSIVCMCLCCGCL